MALFLYEERDSIIHRLHPVTKILCLLMSFLAALAFSHPLYVLPLFLVVLIPGFRAGAWSALKRVWPLMLLIGLVSFVLWGLLQEGQTVIYALGPLKFKRESLMFGAGMAIRLNLMLFCGLIFLASTRVEDFTAGLNAMGLPYAVSFALSLSFRLVPIFSETAETILKAQRARGLDTEAKGLLTRFRSYVPLLVPVFASALRRTDMLAMALESKGFGASGTRTQFREYSFALKDWATLAVVVLITAGCISLRVLGYGGV